MFGVPDNNNEKKKRTEGRKRKQRKDIATERTHKYRYLLAAKIALFSREFIGYLAYLLTFYCLVMSLVTFVGPF